MATISMSKLDLSGIVWLPLKDDKPTAEPTESKRADLPCPRVVRDITEYRSMQTGEMITSRSQHRDHMKRHNLIELGNEKVDAKKARGEKLKALASTVNDDINQAIKDYKEGKRVNNVQVAENISVPVNSSKPVRANTAAPAPSIIIP